MEGRLFREGYAHGARAGLIPRGYGMAYVAATSSVTQSQIEHVLHNPDRTVEEGDVEYVIGQAKDDTEIILTIIDGTLAAASADGYTNDPCDQSQLVDLEYQEEHYTRNPEDSPEKPYDDRSAVRKLLDDGVDEALEALSGGERYYLKQVGQNQWTVIVLPEVTESVAPRMVNGFTDWFVKTFLTNVDEGTQFFNSADEARDAVEGQNDGVEQVDC